MKSVKEIRKENRVDNDADLNDKAIRFIHFICNELEIKNQIITIGVTNKNVQALIYLNWSGWPMILINSEKVENVFTALAHELTHLKQHLDGKWDLSHGTTIIKHNKNHYVSDLAEEIEREALSKQYKLCKAFRKNERRIRVNERRIKRYNRR